MDPDPTIVDYTLAESGVDPNEMTHMLDRLEGLLAGENYDLMLPYLGSLYISAMRLAGQNAGILVEATSDRNVLNYMYSLGEISGEELNWARHVLQLRNKAIYSLRFDVSKQELLNIYSHIKTKLVEWGSVSLQTSATDPNHSLQQMG